MENEVQLPNRREQRRRSFSRGDALIFDFVSFINKIIIVECIMGFVITASHLTIFAIVMTTPYCYITATIWLGIGGAVILIRSIISVYCITLLKRVMNYRRISARRLAETFKNGFCMFNRFLYIINFAWNCAGFKVASLFLQMDNVNDMCAYRSYIILSKYLTLYSLFFLALIGVFLIELICTLIYLIATFFYTEENLAHIIIRNLVPRHLIDRTAPRFVPPTILKSYPVVLWPQIEFFFLKEKKKLTKFMQKNKYFSESLSCPEFQTIYDENSPNIKTILSAKDEETPKLTEISEESGIKIKTFIEYLEHHFKEEEHMILPDSIKYENNCSICLYDYIYSSIIRIIPCGHYYHKDCIDQWLSEHNTCPLRCHVELAPDNIP